MAFPKRPSLASMADMDDMGPPEEGGPESSNEMAEDPKVQAAGLIMDALDSKDSQALCDALDSYLELKLSEHEMGEGEEPSGSSHKPGLVIHLGHVSK